MKRAALTVAGVVVVVACSPGKEAPEITRAPSSAAAPAEGHVVDSSPYWCDLVPKDALRLVTGPADDLREIRNSTATRDRALCGVKDREKYGPLVVEWDVTGGRNEVAARTKDVAPDRPDRLPPELGYGFSVHSSRSSHLSYLTASAFRCGSGDAWIDIFLRSISPGRDMTRDLVDLMRIAQGRFGKLHRCSPTAVRWPAPGSG
jgi:hypothetical protein